jgi:hypothetical protein
MFGSDWDFCKSTLSGICIPRPVHHCDFCLEDVASNNLKGSRVNLSSLNLLSKTRHSRRRPLMGLAFLLAVLGEVEEESVKNPEAMEL